MHINPIVLEDIERIASTRLPWDQVAGKKVLITGAGGFLAHYLVRTLLFRNDRDHDDIRVIGLVRDRRRSLRLLGGLVERDDFVLLEQDVSEPVSAEVQADIIIHAASQASPKYYGPDPVGTFLPNVIGAWQLLERARQWNCKRMLFLSSAEVYGRAGDGSIAEDTMGRVDPMELRSCYAESKRAGETLCVAYYQQFGVPVSVARLFHTYGPGMRLDDGRVFADFVADALAHRSIQMRSNGLAIRAYCYLSDAVEGLFTVLFRGSPGEAYNIGNPKGALSVQQLADLIVRCHPESPLVVHTHTCPSDGPYVQSTVDRIVPDIGKAEVLGWKPTILPDAGFRRTIQSFQ